MRYSSGRQGNYLSNIVDSLRDTRNVLKAFYTSSEQRAEREGTRLGVALVDNLMDVYHNGLDSLLVPVRVYDGVAVYGVQYATRLPTEFFMGSKSTKHHHPNSNKKKKKWLRKKKRDKAWRKTNLM